MGTEVIAGIFTALGTVAAAGIAIIPQRSGWRNQIQTDLDIFYKLLPLSDGVADDIILSEYRKSIFASVENGMRPSRRWRSVFNTLLALVVIFAIGMLMNHLAGIPITPALIVKMLISIASGWLIGVCACEVLFRFPKTDRNPFYRLSKKDADLKAQTDQLTEEMEREYRDAGWVSNYTAYLGWKRDKWGAYLYQKAVRKDGNSENRDDCRDEDVEAGESDEKGNDVLHDDLQGERDAVDGNATGGVGRDG